MGTKRCLIVLGCIIALIAAACGSPQQEPSTGKAKPTAGSESPWPYVLGQKLNFNQEQVNAYLGEGWSAKEPWGRWTEGPMAELKLGLDRFTADGKYSLDLKCNLYPPNRQRVGVFLNGSEIGQIGPELKSQEVKIQFDGRLLHRDNLVVFKIEKPMSPKEVGESEDPRKLGLGVVTIQIKGD
jgi:hypothetical protein